MTLAEYYKSYPTDFLKTLAKKRFSAPQIRAAVLAELATRA